MIRWLEKNRYAAIILTVLITIEIFYFSSIPGGKVVGIDISWISIAYHLIVFFLFTFFLFISIKGEKEMKPFYLIIVILISILYGALDEFHQIFVPFREPAIQDVLTNTVGIFLSAIVYLYVNKKN